MKLKYFILQKIHRHYFFTKVCAKLYVYDAKKRQMNLFLTIEVHVNNFLQTHGPFLGEKIYENSYP
jgi:hypothetical protein